MALLHLSPDLGLYPNQKNGDMLCHALATLSEDSATKILHQDDVNPALKERAG